MSLRVLVLGASGRLGQGIVQAADPLTALVTPGRVDLDLESASTEDLAVLVRSSGAQVCVNAAAESSVDRAEKEPRRASALNAELPGRLADACQRSSVHLLHLSTDYLFGGRGAMGGPPFGEMAVPSPLQHYGRSKADGESQVRRLGGSWAHIVRVSWLFGPSATGFSDFLAEQLKVGVSERVVEVFLQRSRPTYIPSLACWLLALAQHCVDGGSAPSILHPVGGPPASRKEWAEFLLRAAGHEYFRVIERPIPPERAPRASDCRLCGEATSRWSAKQGLPALMDWRSSGSWGRLFEPTANPRALIYPADNARQPEPSSGTAEHRD